MKTYTGWQYLLIDAANNFGLDKKLFEERIEWVEQNLDKLEEFIDQAETKPLYIKAVMAIRKAQQRVPTGHLVGLDAVCSGIQMMSVLTGCIAGARATGLVDPNVRSDAYSGATQLMSKILGGNVDVSRKDAKNALMTSFYGSKKQPKDIFGEDTPELAAFYQAATELAPGAWELLQDLLASWQPYALSHQWKLPDGYDAYVKVMVRKEARIEVDELDHASFTYEFFENEGQKKGLSNVANLTHSVDAYVLREMHRRCNYDLGTIYAAERVIHDEQFRRHEGHMRQPGKPQGKAGYYADQYERSTLASSVILPHINEENVTQLTDEHLEALSKLCAGMLQYKPFPLVTVHDEFKAHPNNLNWVRWQYREILAEIADSNLLDDLLSQIHGVPGTFQKLSFNLSDYIRKSEYGLC